MIQLGQSNSDQGDKFTIKDFESKTVIQGREVHHINMILYKT